MTPPKLCFALPILFLAALIACSNQQQQQPTPEQIREKTAEATATARNDAKAVADGLREGWDRSKPLDINSASRDQLTSLPGMSGEEADRVIASRPYNDPHELETRRVISKAEYDRIASQITAKR
jgi:competence protein ComEA